jgi:8-oxo-dGTP pyrophosphatase MutT (NUDIX family)
MELCDIVDEFGTRTGRAVARGTKLALGEFILVVHVWIRDETGRYLIQQRALHLRDDPGIWATTAGHVQSGEDSLAGAIREASEEMGLQLAPAQFRRLDRLKIKNRIEDLWLVEVSRTSIGAPTLGPEVADCKWVSKAELEQLASQGDFFAYSYLGDLPE